ncbi:MAG: DUF5686 family protein, partial [Bacteroidota bacterium]
MLIATPLIVLHPVLHPPFKSHSARKTIKKGRLYIFIYIILIIKIATYPHRSYSQSTQLAQATQPAQAIQLAQATQPKEAAIRHQTPSAGKGRLSGQITDATGKPLAFASLQITPGAVGTMSNEQGRFEVDLDTGSYRVQIHYLGYEPKIVTINIGREGLKTKFVLAPQVFNLQEVKVKAGAEDPAYALMRRAVRNAPLHIQALQSYTAQSYVKGTFQIRSAPYLMRKAIEKENFKVGTSYVLESMSDLRYQAPATFTEQVRSMRSSLPPGTENQIRYSQFNLYRPRNGEIISPLAPSSFTHYRFRYRGESRQGEQVIHRIEVEPRSKLPFLFKGDLYLREPHMGIYAINLSFTDDNGISYSVNQQYQPVQGWWMPSTQEIKLKATFLGVSGDMRYVTSLRQYRLQVDTLIFQRSAGSRMRNGDEKLASGTTNAVRVKSGKSGSVGAGAPNSNRGTESSQNSRKKTETSRNKTDTSRSNIDTSGNKTDTSRTTPNPTADSDDTEGGKVNRQTQRAVKKMIQQMNDTAHVGSVDSEEAGITGRDYTYKIDSNASR